MKITEQQRASIQKQIERAIMNTAKEVDGLTVPYLPSLTRGQVGAEFVKLVKEVLTAIEE